MKGCCPALKRKNKQNRPEKVLLSPPDGQFSLSEWSHLILRRTPEPTISLRIEHWEMGLLTDGGVTFLSHLLRGFFSIRHPRLHAGSCSVWSAYFIPQASVCPMSLGPLNTHCSSFVSFCSSAPFLGRNLLCKFNAAANCKDKGVFISLHLDQAPLCFVLFCFTGNVPLFKFLWRGWLGEKSQLASCRMRKGSLIAKEGRAQVLCGEINKLSPQCPSALSPKMQNEVLTL